MIRVSPLVALLACIGCGGSPADAVRHTAVAYYRALDRGDSTTVCRLSTARSRKSFAAAARLQRLAAGADTSAAARATCSDVHLPAGGAAKIVAVRVHGERAWVRVTRHGRTAATPFRRRGDAWRHDGTFPVGNPFPPVPPACAQTWNDAANAAMQTQVLPGAVDLPAAGLLEERQQGGCRLSVRSGRREATFESPPLTPWNMTSRAQQTSGNFNVRVFKDGLLQPLTDVAAGAAPPQPPPPPAPPPAPASAPPAPPPAPWQDCGKIRSPFNRRPLRVEARTFDCRAGRRVAVRYLRNGALPYGWQPTDCAASRAACERGGWGFRVIK